MLAQNPYDWIFLIFSFFVPLQSLICFLRGDPLKTLTRLVRELVFILSNVIPRRFLGVGRFIRDDVESGTVDKKDLGARLIWKGDEDSGVPAALSVEYVRRFVTGDADTDKLVAVLEYRIPFEGISLVAIYGKTLESDFTGREDLVSTLGINFGFGRGPIDRALSVSSE